MRIIIDMQGLQTVSLVREHGLRLLALLQDVARNSNSYDVHLLLNGALQQNILDIRCAFSEWVSAHHIHIFDIPLPIASNDSFNSARLDLAKTIYTQLILGLNPDILLLTQSLSAGWTDNVVTPIKSLNHSVTTAVLWLETDKVFFEAASSNNLSYKQWCVDRLNTFATEQNIIVGSTDLREELIDKWGTPDQQIIAIESKADSENPNVLKLISCLELVSRPKLSIIEAIRKQRPRLAYVSPLPPEKTGIADYSAELIPELAYYFDIELITDQPIVSLCDTDKKYTIRSVAWFKQNHQYYQRVLYHFGNNWEFHGYMFALIKKIPGIVVLHDFFLGHVMAGMELRGELPQAWNNALFKSHGYSALKQRFQTSEFNQVQWDYPCNLDVIQDALGVIVHSQNSLCLAKQWLGIQSDIDWSVIPLLRAPAEKIDRSLARSALNWHQDHFIVCSFGFLGPNKLNQRLLEIWLKSALAENENCLLVFVGESSGDYGKTLIKTIKISGTDHRVIITGWINTAQFRQYLAAADLAVQLRTLSRGETSAAVLDCMNYGLPTIVNANGSMADLPNDAVWMLPDQFSDSEMVTALETLWHDDLQRQQLAARGQQLILTQHKPSVCAEQYALTIESLYQQAAKHPNVVVQALANLENLPCDDQSLANLAKTIAVSFPPQPLPRQLLIDVSSIARHDLKSGIERVVRAQLIELLKNPPKGYRIEPVYLTDQGGAWHYQYARNYTCKILGIEQVRLADAPVDIATGDVLYVADFYPGGVIEAHKSGLYSKWQARGIAVNFLVYDLLPIQKPECFPSGADSVHTAWLKVITEVATGLICISNSVANELSEWLQSHHPARKTNLPITINHLGADIEASAPSTGRPDHSAQLLTKLSAIPSFIMVGTIEPRKGHLQALAAFELLWKQGLQVNLVIVGKEGWVGLPDKERRTIPKILAKLRNHKELGRRLFWLEGISDEYLEQIYATCTCLIAASEAEGFGLPLIEAAQHQLPIIIRDIPVFKEVAGEYAYYFEGLEAESLSQAILAWLYLYTKGSAPESSKISWLTWAQSVQQLLEQIIPKAINIKK